MYVGMQFDVVLIETFYRHIIGENYLVKFPKKVKLDKN